MIQNEINEIRRRLSPDKGAIGRIYGCYVNNRKEIIATMDTSLGVMYQSESEKFLALFKKILSGGIDRSMVNIEFTTDRVMNGPQHKILMNLRSSELGDEASREELFKNIIDAVNFGDLNYLILLISDNYDVPVKTKDGEGYNDSDTVFSYIMCCVCPVKQGKAELGYMAGEQEFKSYLPPMCVASPQLGFMFPTFEDRGANIYNALFYTKNPSEMYDDFINSVFGTETPMSAVEQKETFADTLSETLDNECSLDVVQAVHEKIRQRIALHKECKEIENLEFDAADVGDILKEGGVTPEVADAFEEKCVERFGDNAHLKPENIINSKKFEIETPQIKISVEPEYSYSVKTRIIDGRKYILIPADEGVTVNGINVKIPLE